MTPYNSAAAGTACNSLGNSLSSNSGNSGNSGSGSGSRSQPREVRMSPASPSPGGGGGGGASSASTSVGLGSLRPSPLSSSGLAASDYFALRPSTNTVTSGNVMMPAIADRTSAIFPQSSSSMYASQLLFRGSESGSSAGASASAHGRTLATPSGSRQSSNSQQPLPTHIEDGSGMRLVVAYPPPTATAPVAAAATATTTTSLFPFPTSRATPSIHQHQHHHQHHHHQQYDTTEAFRLAIPSASQMHLKMKSSSSKGPSCGTLSSNTSAVPAVPSESSQSVISAHSSPSGALMTSSSNMVGHQLGSTASRNITRHHTSGTVAGLTQSEVTSHPMLVTIPPSASLQNGTADLYDRPMSIRSVSTISGYQSYEEDLHRQRYANNNNNINSNITSNNNNDNSNNNNSVQRRISYQPANNYNSNNAANYSVSRGGSGREKQQSIRSIRRRRSVDGDSPVSVDPFEMDLHNRADISTSGRRWKRFSTAIHKAGDGIASILYRSFVRDGRATDRRNDPPSRSMIDGQQQSNSHLHPHSHPHSQLPSHNKEHHNTGSESAADHDGNAGHTGNRRVGGIIGAGGRTLNAKPSQPTLFGSRRLFVLFERNPRFWSLAIPMFVMAIGLIVAAITYYVITASLADGYQRSLTRKCQMMENALESALSNLRLSLRGYGGFISTQNTASAESANRYVDNAGISFADDMFNIFYAPILTKDERKNWETNNGKVNITTFNGELVNQLDSLPYYAPIEIIQPQNNTRNIIGYDLLSYRVVRSTIAAALDQRKPILSNVNRDIIRSNDPRGAKYGGMVLSIAVPVFASYSPSTIGEDDPTSVNTTRPTRIGNLHQMDLDTPAPGVPSSGNSTLPLSPTNNPPPPRLVASSSDEPIGVVLGNIDVDKYMSQVFHYYDGMYLELTMRNMSDPTVHFNQTIYSYASQNRTLYPDPTSFFNSMELFRPSAVVYSVTVFRQMGLDMNLLCVDLFQRLAQSDPYGASALAIMLAILVFSLALSILLLRFMNKLRTTRRKAIRHRLELGLTRDQLATVASQSSAILEAVADPLMAMDGRGYIIGGNLHLLNITGYGREEFESLISNKSIHVTDILIPMAEPARNATSTHDDMTPSSEGSSSPLDDVAAAAAAVAVSAAAPGVPITESARSVDHIQVPMDDETNADGEDDDNDDQVPSTAISGPTATATVTSNPTDSTLMSTTLGSQRTDSPRISTQLHRRGTIHHQHQLHNHHSHHHHYHSHQQQSSRRSVHVEAGVLSPQVGAAAASTALDSASAHRLRVLGPVTPDVDIYADARADQSASSGSVHSGPIPGGIRDVYVLRKDGSSFVAQANFSSFSDHNIQVVVFRDMTMKLAAERAIIDAKEVAERANKFKSDFLAFLCHEIRNPAHAIMGFAEIIRDTVIQRNPELTEDVNCIITAANFMGGIVDDVLDLTEMTDRTSAPTAHISSNGGALRRGKHRRTSKIKPTTAVLQTLVPAVVRIAAGASSLADRGIKTELRMEPDLPNLKVDVEQLHRVIRRTVEHMGEISAADGVVVVEVTCLARSFPQQQQQPLTATGAMNLSESNDGAIPRRHRQRPIDRQRAMTILSYQDMSTSINAQADSGDMVQQQQQQPQQSQRLSADALGSNRDVANQSQESSFRVDVRRNLSHGTGQLRPAAQPAALAPHAPPQPRPQSAAFQNLLPFDDPSALKPSSTPASVPPPASVPTATVRFKIVCKPEDVLMQSGPPVLDSEFNPFLRQNLSSGQRFHSSGVVLALIQATLKAMGSDLVVTREGQMGIIFFDLTLPIVQSSDVDESTATGPIAPSASYAGTEKPHVLDLVRYSTLPADTASFGGQQSQQTTPLVQRRGLHRQALSTEMRIDLAGIRNPIAMMMPPTTTNNASGVQSKPSTVTIVSPHQRSRSHGDAATTQSISTALAPEHAVVDMASPVPLGTSTDTAVAAALGSASVTQSPEAVTSAATTLVSSTTDQPLIHLQLPQSQSAVMPSKMSILLVEDNKIVQRVTSKMLRKNGFDVTAVDDGQAAVELIVPDFDPLRLPSSSSFAQPPANPTSGTAAAASVAVGLSGSNTAASTPLGTRKCRFSLILMDLITPRIDGYEATRIIRQNSFDLPIVALTANSIQEDKQRCLELGANEFLTKPIGEAQLVKVLTSHIEIYHNNNNNSGSDPTNQ